MKPNKSDESANRATIEIDDSDVDVPKKTVIGFHSNLGVANIEATEEVSETEIAAEISIPKEGSWGWVVVVASFVNLFILDGTFFTFGALYKDIAQDLQTEESLVALINSVSVALYFFTGPIVSALINRYGFRFCAMIGSIIVSFSYFFSYFAETYVILLILYGVLPGLGGCFIYMSSQLVVGFYFERLRALAMALTGLGQSCGVMIMSNVNNYLCQLAGWRTTTLFHSGFFGLVYFIAMIYRPLVSLTVSPIEEQARPVTYLPSLSTMSLASPSRRSQRLSSSPALNRPNTAERVFKAVSNVNFPTVADLVEEIEEEDEAEDDKKIAIKSDKESEERDYVSPGPSSKAPQRSSSVKSLKSNKYQRRISIKPSQMALKDTAEEQKSKKLKWWQKCCRWEKHAEESRPMYRDDAFYNGALERLPAYQKSLMSTKREKTGLEYRMAVSRTVTPDDLKERKGIFTTAMRRTLATMLNTALLRRCSFLFVCTAGFLVHVGLLIPYVFLPDRNRRGGIEQKHCNLFVSVIGFSNTIGRLIAGILACRLNPTRVYSAGCLIAGTSSIVSNFSYNLYFQYLCCVLFGLGTAHISTLRSLVIVYLYGLDNLTNATGMLLMFQGLGFLLSTPLASVLKSNFGYLISFCVSGSFMVIGGILVFLVKSIAEKERIKLDTKKYTPTRSRSITIKKADKKK